MGKCCICEKTEKETRIIKRQEKFYCRKHYLQLYRHNKILSRTIYDKNEIRIEGEIAYISCYNKNGEFKGEVLIDKEDINLIENYKIYITKKYAKYSLNGEKYFVHQTILKTNKTVDHINHNTLDNRKSNLRIANHQQNAFNIKKDLWKGVRQVPSGRYTAHIYKGDYFYLGTYDTKEEALFVRYLKEIELFGEFRDTSFDEEKLKIFKKQKFL